MMKRNVLLALAVVAALGFAAPAGATPFEWLTRPILGTASQYTGDVVVITGPTPTTPGGDVYYAWPGGPVVLGPTIPHYSLVGDPLYGVGSPSLTVFDFGQTVFTGSGVYVDQNKTYHIEGKFSFLGNGVVAPYSFLRGVEDYSSGANAFVMDMIDSDDTGWVLDPRVLEVGNWNYTETWTESALTGATPRVISASQDFTVVPEPASLTLLGLGLAGAFRAARRRK